MTPSPFIPPATRRELISPAAPGARHEQAVRVAASLVASGVHRNAVFTQLRAMYDPSVSDREIQGIVLWAEGKRFNRNAWQCTPSTVHFARSGAVSTKTTLTPAERIRAFIRGTPVEKMSFSDLLAELQEASPCRLPDDWTQDSAMLIAGAYDKDDRINIVAESNPDGGPGGRGQCFTRDEWLKRIATTGTPQGGGGAWVRMNPTDGQGVADSNIVRFRFALLELDSVPLGLQLSLVCRLRLPLVALITSGGRSIHAWVNVGAKNVESYRTAVMRLLDLLKPFGCDQSNKNPSRLSRLPGANRPSSESEDKRQRLLYFAPDRTDNRPIL